MKPAVVILLILFCSVSIAQIPGTLSYQGILMQNDGITPLTDGAKTSKEQTSTTAISQINHRYEVV